MVTDLLIGHGYQDEGEKEDGKLDEGRHFFCCELTVGLTCSEDPLSTPPPEEEREDTVVEKREREESSICCLLSSFLSLLFQERELFLCISLSLVETASFIPFSPQIITVEMKGRPRGRVNKAHGERKGENT